MGNPRYEQQQNPRDERLARLAALAQIGAQQDAQDTHSQAAMIEQMKTMYGLQQESQLAPEHLRALQLENTGRETANQTGALNLAHRPAELAMQDYLNSLLGQEGEAKVAGAQLSQQGEKTKLDWLPTQLGQQYNEGEQKVATGKAEEGYYRAHSGLLDKQTDTLEGKDEATRARGEMMHQKALQDAMQTIYALRTVHDKGGALTPEEQQFLPQGTKLPGAMLPPPNYGDLQPATTGTNPMLPPPIARKDVFRRTY